MPWLTPKRFEAAKSGATGVLAGGAEGVAGAGVGAEGVGVGAEGVTGATGADVGGETGAVTGAATGVAVGGLTGAATGGDTGGLTGGGVTGGDTGGLTGAATGGSTGGAMNGQRLPPVSTTSWPPKVPERPMPPTLTSFPSGDSMPLDVAIRPRLKVDDATSVCSDVKEKALVKLLRL